MGRLARRVPARRDAAPLCARAGRLIGRLSATEGKIALFSHSQFGAALQARWIGLPVVDGQQFARHPASLSLPGHEAAYPDRRMIDLWNETSTV